MLQARGVRLSVQDGRLVTSGPPGAITPDLGEQIRAQKAELVHILQFKDAAPSLIPLPEPLARLVYAAVGNHLNRPGFLTSGIVMNLGEYVLATTALYAVGHDTQRQLSDLWEARRAWTA